MTLREAICQVILRVDELVKNLKDRIACSDELTAHQTRKVRLVAHSGDWYLYSSIYSVIMEEQSSFVLRRWVEIVARTLSYIW